MTGSARGIIYLTAKLSVQGGGYNPAQYRMYALRLSDLGNASGFNGGQPVVLGHGLNTHGPHFHATNELQRPALLQVGNLILAGFGSHCSAPRIRAG